MENCFCINRRLEPGFYSLEEVFADIRACGVLHTIFADATEIDSVITHTRVIVSDHSYEMFVDNKNGSINIGLNHLKSSTDEILYLDIIHELCHVRQQLQGRNLYDRSKSYVDRETEIEAYLITVQEARRIGLNEEAICDYLRVPWLTPEDHGRLVRRLDVNAGSQKSD